METIGLQLKPVPKTNLLARTVRALQDGILGGRHRPGTELPGEGQMAADLGVSRTLLREAMRVLEARGLVEVCSGRRPRVAEGSPEAVSTSLDVLLRQGNHGLMQLLEVRRGLEGEIAALAAERATPEQIEALQQCVDEIREHPGQYERMADADVRFHMHLADAAGNALFRVMLDPLSKVLRASCERTHQSPTGSMASANRHQKLLDAIKSRSPEAARKAMWTHLKTAKTDIEQATRNDN
jgi:GntR family transcriptional repressor for pyruvate dehydrogenase complex